MARPDAPAEDRPTDTPRQMDYTDDAEEDTDTETEPPQTLDQLSDELERRADAAELLAQPDSGGVRSHDYQAGKVAGLRDAVSAVRALAHRQAGNEAPDRSDDVELVTDGGLATLPDPATAAPDDLVGQRVRVEGIEQTFVGEIVAVQLPEEADSAQVGRRIDYVTDDGDEKRCYTGRAAWDIEVLEAATDGGGA